MKLFVCFILLLSLTACGGKSGKEEKELATQAFINCEFYDAISKAKSAIEYAKDNVELSVPALLILGKSSEFIGETDAANSAYEQIVQLAPGITSVSGAKEIANNFIAGLASAAPEQVKACSQLQL